MTRKIDKSYRGENRNNQDPLEPPPKKPNWLLGNKPLPTRHTGNKPLPTRYIIGMRDHWLGREWEEASLRLASQESREIKPVLMIRYKLRNRDIVQWRKITPEITD